MNAHTAIKVEKGIPLPDGLGEVGRPQMYPFGQMDVGDSFALPLSGEEDAHRNGNKKWDKAHRRVVNAANSYGRTHKKKFASRAFPAEGIFRVWRIA